MKLYCPFAVYGEFECVYRDAGYICEDIEVCPGNTDAMCGGFVQANLESKERQFTSANK